MKSAAVARQAGSAQPGGAAPQGGVAHPGPGWGGGGAPPRGGGAWGGGGARGRPARRGPPTTGEQPGVHSADPNGKPDVATLEIRAGAPQACHGSSRCRTAARQRHQCDDLVLPNDSQPAWPATLGACQSYRGVAQSVLV